MKVNLERIQSVTKEDVESIELEHGEFVNSESNVRIYHLNNHDAFTIKDTSFEFYDNLFYEVTFGGYEFEVDGVGVNPIWNRTGKVYTGEELNNTFTKEND